MKGTPRLQASLGRVQEVYKEGSTVNTLMLARVTKVNYQYNTVDVETIGSYGADSFANSHSTDGRFSAKLPIEFGGTNYLGKAYGQINPVEVGNNVLIGFINAKKTAPIVLGVYNDDTSANLVAQVPFSSADPYNEDVKSVTNMKYTLYPSLTYSHIDGKGNRTVSFTGKTFFITSDRDTQNSSLSDDGNGAEYESLGSSYYNDGELIEPVSAQAPIVLFKHQGITNEDGTPDTHQFTLYISKDGTYRVSTSDKEEDRKSYYELNKDGSIDLVQQRDSKIVGRSEAYSRISILKDGTVALRNGKVVWELRKNGVYYNGGSPVESEMSQSMENVNGVLQYQRQAQQAKVDATSLSTLLKKLYKENAKENKKGLSLDQRNQILPYYLAIQSSYIGVQKLAKELGIDSALYTKALTSLQDFIESNRFFEKSEDFTVEYQVLSDYFTSYYDQLYRLLMLVVNSKVKQLTTYEKGIYNASTSSTQTDTEILLQAQKMEVMENTIEENQAQLKIQADKIAQTVTKTEVVNLVQDGIQNIRIGGRNYFDPKNVVSLGLSTNGHFLQGDKYIGWYFPVSTSEVLTIKRWSTPNNRFSYVFSEKEPKEQGEFFGGNFGTVEAEGTVFQNIEVPTNANYLFLFLSTNKDTLPKIKVEFGSIPTDWTIPDSAIDTALTEIKTSVGKLETTSSNIEASVTEQKKTITEHGETLSTQKGQIDVLSNEISAKVDVDGVITAINLDKSGVKIDAGKLTIDVGGVNYINNSEKEVFVNSEGVVMSEDWEVSKVVDERGTDRWYSISFNAQTSNVGKLEVYMEGKYTMSVAQIDTTSDYQRFTIPVQLKKTETATEKAYIRLRAVTGDNPKVKNMQFEVSSTASDYKISESDTKKETGKIADEKIENLEISTRNLFRGFPKNTAWRAEKVESTYVEFPYNDPTYRVLISPNKTYTLGWDYHVISGKADSLTDNVVVGYYLSNTFLELGKAPLKAQYTTFNTDRVTSSTPLVVRFSVTEAKATSTVDYSSLMLVEGNKKVGWVPNLADTRVYKAYASSLDTYTDFTKKQPNPNLAKDSLFPIGGSWHLGGIVENERYLANSPVFEAVSDSTGNWAVIHDTASKIELTPDILTYSYQISYKVLQEGSLGLGKTVRMTLKEYSDSKAESIASKELWLATEDNQWHDLKGTYTLQKKETNYLAIELAFYDKGKIQVSRPKIEEGTEVTPFVCSSDEDRLLSVLQYEGTATQDSDDPKDYTWAVSTEYMSRQVGNKVDSSAYTQQQQDMYKSIEQKASTEDLQQAVQIAQEVTNQFNSFIADGGTFTQIIQSIQDRQTGVEAKIGDKKFVIDSFDGFLNFAGDTMVLGNKNKGLYASIDPNEIGFWNGTTRVATFGKNGFKVPNGAILNSMQIGAHKMTDYGEGNTVFEYVVTSDYNTTGGNA